MPGWPTAVQSPHGSGTGPTTAAPWASWRRARSTAGPRAARPLPHSRACLAASRGQQARRREVRHPAPRWPRGTACGRASAAPPHQPKPAGTRARHRA
eukprot:1746000-Pyramimonas_sp.AAC.1